MTSVVGATLRDKRPQARAKEAKHAPEKTDSGYFTTGDETHGAPLSSRPSSELSEARLTENTLEECETMSDPEEEELEPPVVPPHPPANREREDDEEEWSNQSIASEESLVTGRTLSEVASSSRPSSSVSGVRSGQPTRTQEARSTSIQAYKLEVQSRGC